MRRGRGGATLARMDTGKRVDRAKPTNTVKTDPATLLALWRDLPYVDPDEFRRDIDRVIDPSL